MPSIRRNSLLNAGYEVARLVFPIITYPYVSRVLGPTGWGRVSFARSVADHFIAIALVGLPLHGMRAISRSRDDQTKLSVVFSELACLNFVAAIVWGGLYVLLPVLVPSIASDSVLYWLFGLTVILSFTRVDWTFQGLEKYAYITTRNLTIRTLSTFLVFAVVRTRDDYVIYGTIWVGGNVLTGLFNARQSFKSVRLRLSDIDPLRHVRAMLLSFAAQLVGTRNNIVDVLAFGILLNDDRYSVGIYAMSMRVNRIPLSLLSAGQAVVRPRINQLSARGDDEKREHLIRMSFSFVLYLSLPFAFGITLVAPEFIWLFARADFEPAIHTTRVLSILIVVHSLSSVVSFQIIYPQKLDHVLIASSAFSLFVSVVVNALAVPRYQHNGAAAAAVAAATMGLLFQSWSVRHQLAGFLINRENARILILVAIWVLGSLVIYQLMDFESVTISLFTIVACSATLYAILSVVLRVQLLRVLRFRRAGL